MSLTFRPQSKTISAPTSPSRSGQSFLQKMTSLTRDAIGKAESVASKATGPGFNRDRCRTLLVIDDQNTDWSKYFRGKRLPGDYDIRVEQAEFKELSVNASSEMGTTVSMVVHRGGTKVVRSFKPDFVLIRQNMRDAGEDYKNILLGLKFGEVPSVNSLNSVYAFQDKPWVFAHLQDIQQRTGKDNFPLIEQTYFPNCREMIATPKFPIVLKIGHAHGGLGKVKIENHSDFQDLASVVAVANTYCTIEPYIESRYDVHIQKIGTNYKAFMRKSISGNWKTNLGSSLLEQQEVTDKWRMWVDAVSQLFGGLDICAIEAVVSKDGNEYIIEVNDSALSLFGESQEEDRRHIAELTYFRMQQHFASLPPKEDPTGVAPAPAPARRVPSASKPTSVVGSPTNEERPLPGATSTGFTAEQLKQREELFGATRGGPPPTAPPPAPQRPAVPPPPAVLAAAAPAQPPPGPPPVFDDDGHPPIPSLGSAAPAPVRERRDSQGSYTSSKSGVSTTSSASAARGFGPGARATSVDVASSDMSGPPQPPPRQQPAPPGGVQAQQSTESRSLFSRQTSQQSSANDEDDTMKNLRKTFAGIFGDM